MEEEFVGLPGIEDYLSSHGDGHPIEVKELDHIIDAVVAYCGVTREQSTRIVSLFFQEIRSSMLSGEVVDIRGLGSFFVSSPTTTNNAKKIFSRFKPKRSLVKRMNSVRNRE